MDSEGGLRENYGRSRGEGVVWASIRSHGSHITPHVTATIVQHHAGVAELAYAAALEAAGH